MQKFQVVQPLSLCFLSLVGAARFEPQQGREAEISARLATASLPPIPGTLHRWTFKPSADELKKVLSHIQKKRHLNSGLQILEVRGEMAEPITLRNFRLQFSRPLDRQHFAMKKPSLDLGSISSFVDEINHVFGKRNRLKTVTISIRER